MIIVCQKCATRLQVEDEKSSNRPFSVRCPKCNSTVNSGSANPATEQSALAIGGSPATDHPRFEQSTARAYEAPAQSSTSTVTSDETVRQLFDLLSRNTRSNNEDAMARPSWDKRKALVCTSEAYRDGIARKLTDSGFQVFVAEDTRRTRVGICDPGDQRTAAAATAPPLLCARVAFAAHDGRARCVSQQRQCDRERARHRRAAANHGSSIARIQRTLPRIL